MPHSCPEIVSLTLTTSESLARILRRDHALVQKRAGHTAWEVPPIHGLRRWCRDQWLQSWPSAQLLHGVQELALWQRAIEDDGAAAAVLSHSALAREARAMGRLVAHYRIDTSNIPCYTDEHHAFVRWHRAVRQDLDQKDWVLECELPALVANMVKSGYLSIPASLSVVGARHQLSPQEKYLIQVLEQAGCHCELASAPAQTATVHARSYADDNQQLRGLAQAISECLLAAEAQDEAPPVILVTCPDAQARRAGIEAAFRPILAPWLLLPGEGQRPLPWRFASGLSLDQQPLVAAALSICGLTETANTLDELSRLLLASVLWTPEQRQACAKADYALRDLGGTQFPLRLLARHVPEPLGMRFQKLLEQLRHEPRRALPSQWVELFNTRLALLGWPGERALVSTAFQVREHWALALATFSAMDQQIGEVPHGRALGWLREIVSSRPFEARADHDQPILILDPSEAIGLPADHLFVLDATNDALPGPVKRHPLLATEALLAAGVPDVTADSALATAQAWVSHIQTLTRVLHLSYAQLDARGAERQPTSLFGPELSWATPQPAGRPLASERAASGNHLVWPADDPVPPVRDASAEGIFGGTRIFKDYVEAPFFAFCKYRLGIEPLPRAPAGIPPRAQGMIAHAVLEQLWSGLKSKQALDALTDTLLAERVDEPLDRALLRHLPPERFGKILRAMERARLRDVILQWLAHERRRVEPFEVMQCEHAVSLKFEGLDLRLIIDRVDRVQTQDGERYLILDYKTGREAETRGWKADRLQEPQLPLYATSAALGELGIARADGIAFAHLKDGHPALAAATNWAMGLIEPKRRFAVQSWPEQLTAWRATLTLIARGFLAGEAGLEEPGQYRYSVNRELLALVREQP
jgi:ATP-dependent helicase/nuclease subunit B